MLLISLELAALAAVVSPAAANEQAEAAIPTEYCDRLERAADPEPISVHDLATCYFLGQGRPRDLARARTLYARASDRGFARAMCALGNMMIAGEGGARDVAQGLALCRRAAEAGEAQAQTDLGGYLLMGEVVPKDAVEARRWLSLAAEQRQANAAFLLGQIYWNGDGAAKDEGAAARWWLVAHEGGRPDAAFLLGRAAVSRLRRNGAGAVDPALVAEALNWFEIASRNETDMSRRQHAVEQSELLRQIQASLRERGL